MAYTTIDDPTSFFNTVLYTGNATDDRTVTGVGFQPDWSWLKDRTNGNHHRLYDSVRGATKVIYSSLTNAEGTASDGLKSFDSDGFTLGTGSDENGNSANFVSWNWLAGGSASSNSDGSITSSVSANTTAGFSIVSYAGNSTAGATVGHGLGSAPTWILGKNRTDADTWFMYHGSLGGGFSMGLNNTNAKDSNTAFWNSTAPSSTVFTLGNNTDANETGKNFIAYCFAEIKGYSKFGSYTGNGNTDGTFVYTGFKPAWVMYKRSSSSGNDWVIVDNKRDPINVCNEELYANLNSAKGDVDLLDFTSNGFKCRRTHNSQNGSGSTYIYLAFAESPFVNSNGIPNNAR
jgi:hypothetical protein